MNEPCLCEAFVRIAELGNALGIVLNKLPGCWEHSIDERWRIAVNGHETPMLSSLSNVPVEPFTCYVEYNGWPAGLLTPCGGVIAAGSCANEEEFIAALIRAIPGREDN
jgi:hypothetical protein